MTEITPSQIYFVIRSSDYPWYESSTLEELIKYFKSLRRLRAIEKVAIKMAVGYQLSYDENGNIVLGNRPTVDSIRAEVQNIGMWIPYAFRSSPESALTYFQDYGQYYLSIDKPHIPPEERKVYPRNYPYKQAFRLANNPALTGNDIYLTVTRELLRDLFTDFDLFDTFPFLSQPDVISKISNRPQLIDTVLLALHPAGYFTKRDIYSNEGNYVIIKHTIQNQEIQYVGDEIMTMARDGRLYFGSNPLPNIGLYQIAVRFSPKYADEFAGLRPGGYYCTHNGYQFYELFEKYYNYFLRQIHIAEQRGEPKIRFTERFSEFNTDLDRGQALPDAFKSKRAELEMDIAKYENLCRGEDLPDISKLQI